MTQTPRQSIKATYFEDIEENYVKSWMVDDVLGAGELTCFYGLPGGYKSTLVGDLACHVATGRPWFGRETKPGVVIYIAAERASLVKRRFRAWSKRHGVVSAPIVVLEGGFDLCASEACAIEVAEIGRHAAEHYGLPVVWVIIDTKARTMGAADPNQDHEAISYVANIAAMQTGLGGPHVTVIDHVPHGSPERMKGSGAFGGQFDGSFLIKKVGTATGLMTIGSKPPNDGPDELDITFGVEAVEIGIDATGKPTMATVITGELDRPAARRCARNPGRHPTVNGPGRRSNSLLPPARPPQHQHQIHQTL